ncbi:MAG: FAD-dependent oxidoreductase [Rhodopseudomonas palustris]|uniref:FAD-dependent oxidoreductase n=1 Tax=Rhodopseudomonas palustris TaxID=1076 RepID=A0A933VVM3_RHOPL|nr:FAD-dependent oxidoreductase [Rhodopseudomonas palustris]
MQAHSKSTAPSKSSVLIVGAGPVGLTLAIDLAQRGLDITVVETRSAGEPPNVKCNHVSARSMEVFRRLGLAQQLRDTGLPADFPNDCAYRTTATGIEMSRIKIPARRDRYTATDGPDTHWPTAEPPHRINQIYLEPVLFAHAAATDGVTILNRTAFEGFTQDGHGITATLRDLDSDASLTIAADYLVGCDGARSSVRKAIGAQLSGTPVIQSVQSTYIRAPQLLAMLGEPAWMTLALNPRRCGTVVAIDGRETWLIHNHLNRAEETFDSVDRDWSIRTILGVGPEFDYEILTKEDWVGRRLVADRFRDGRAFICGDAAHLWMPYAGYGMNAGIADATNLAWLLGAVLQRWASPDILDAYEAERLPITEQVSHFAMDMAGKVLSQRRAVPEEVEAPGPEGDAVRQRVGQAAYDLNVQQYCCGGLNFGYFYDRSPIIAYDGAPPPAYSMAEFTPSSVPGCRVPFSRLPDGRPITDAIGPGYTLLRRDPSIDVDALVDPLRRAGAPVAVVDIAPGAAALYDHALLLVRTDQHIAWRGDAVPADADGLADKLLGRKAKLAQAA